MKPQMNTDEHGSVLTKPKILCKLPRIFLRGLLGAHTSRVPVSDTLGTLEACAPRDDLRVSAVGFFWLRLGCSVFICVHLWLRSYSAGTGPVCSIPRRRICPIGQWSPD